MAIIFKISTFIIQSDKKVSQYSGYNSYLDRQILNAKPWPLHVPVYIHTKCHLRGCMYRVPIINILVILWIPKNILCVMKMNPFLRLIFTFLVYFIKNALFSNQKREDLSVWIMCFVVGSSEPHELDHTNNCCLTPKIPLRSPFVNGDWKYFSLFLVWNIINLKGEHW